MHAGFTQPSRVKVLQTVQNTWCHQSLKTAGLQHWSWWQWKVPKWLPTRAPPWHDPTHWSIRSGRFQRAASHSQMLAASSPEARPSPEAELLRVCRLGLELSGLVEWASVWPMFPSVQVVSLLHLIPSIWVGSARAVGVSGDGSHGVGGAVDYAHRGGCLLLLKGIRLPLLQQLLLHGARPWHTAACVQGHGLWAELGSKQPYSAKHNVAGDVRWDG